MSMPIPDQLNQKLWKWNLGFSIFKWFPGFLHWQSGWEPLFYRLNNFYLQLFPQFQKCISNYQFNITLLFLGHLNLNRPVKKYWFCTLTSDMLKPKDVNVNLIHSVSYDWKQESSLIFFIVKSLVRLVSFRIYMNSVSFSSSPLRTSPSHHHLFGLLQ